MSRPNEFQTALSGFSKSEEFATLKGFPADFTNDTVNVFSQMMAEYGYKTLKSWNADVLSDILLALEETADKDDSDESNTILIFTYDVIRSFLQYAAANNYLGSTPQKLDEMLDDFEAESGLQGPPMPFDLDKSEPVEMQDFDDGLPQWLEYVYNDIDAYTQKWADEYVKSPNWKERQKGVTKDLVATSISILTDYAYGIYRKTPKTWTKTAIDGVLTTRFVSNANFSDEEYRLIGPALTGLLDFVADKGWLNKKRAENYTRWIDDAAVEMVELSKDPSNFGTSKLVANKMLEQGIDMTDQDAVDKFIDEINENGGIDSLKDDNFDPSELIDDEEDDDFDVNELIGNPELLANVAEMYDGDKKQKFLSNPRKDEWNSRKWDKNTAIDVHNQGVQFGLLLLLQADTYNWTNPDAVKVVADIVDVLYAQNIETPQQWSTATWKEFGTWVREEQPAGEMDLLNDLLTMLGNVGIFPAKKIKQLLSALNGNVVSLDKVRKSKGKIKHKKKR
ncbi:hypothetical protein [Companilactobacillus ginsenosidimutans]|uniref:Uncharacterized protein n=1 Tax=Companilactobacillus ginsenosidimutans TaxID=1007676 RepID=A0A0H4R187_9LACO|nr:hypothetical protein [Companilactobacillus ginsenosidimutans]AKP67470.1 hypothetical protein ABM34_07965 [Companilactobacillus ginsenosidimutans]